MVMAVQQGDATIKEEEEEVAFLVPENKSSSSEVLTLTDRASVTVHCHISCHYHVKIHHD